MRHWARVLRIPAELLWFDLPGVLSLAQYHFEWVVGLLDQASYDDTTGRKLHIALAELGQLIDWLGLLRH